MAALPPVNNPQTALDEVKQLGVEHNAGGLRPGRRHWFCDLLDVITAGQAAAEAAGDQAAARRWQDAYDEWELVYAAITGDAPDILPGALPECCDRHRPPVRPEDTL
jgi:hypothetical protein